MIIADIGRSGPRSCTRHQAAFKTGSYARTRSITQLSQNARYLGGQDISDSWGDLLCQDILLKTSCIDYETLINLWVLFPSLSKMYISAALLFYLPLVQFQFSYASSSPDLVRSVSAYAKRDGHHNHNAIPLLEVNETEITLYHAPTPPSYYTIDWEDEGYEKRYGGLMIAHGLFMSLAFFIALPMGLLFL